jgi:hypothetical protein
MAEVRPFLDRIEKYVDALSTTNLRDPTIVQAIDAIAHDAQARARFLAFARDADEPTVRARMVKLAQRLGWLSEEDEQAELAALIRDRLAGRIDSADVELACALNDAHELDAVLPTIGSPSPADTLGRSAVLACLGSREARTRVLPALLSSSDAEFEMAQVYLRHRPLVDAEELRALTTGIASASEARVQVRALDALASQHVSDPDSLEELTRLFPVAQSAGVQGAIAGVLLRSDYDAIATPEVVQTLRESRLEPHAGSEMIDALLRRLEAQ